MTRTAHLQKHMIELELQSKLVPLNLCTLAHGIKRLMRSRLRAALQNAKNKSIVVED